MTITIEYQFVNFSELLHLTTWLMFVKFVMLNGPVGLINAKFSNRLVLVLKLLDGTRKRV